MAKCQKCGRELDEMGDCRRCIIEEHYPILGAMFKLQRGEPLTIPEVMRLYGEMALLIARVYEQQAKETVRDAEEIARGKEGQKNDKDLS